MLLPLSVAGALAAGCLERRNRAQPTGLAVEPLEVDREPRAEEEPRSGTFASPAVLAPPGGSGGTTASWG